MSSKKRRNKKRSHTNKYEKKATNEFKKKKVELSESAMIAHGEEDKEKLLNPTPTVEETVVNIVETVEPVEVERKTIETKEQVIKVQEQIAEETKGNNHKHRKTGYYKNISQVISEKKERYKEMGVSQRVKRGMVFWYDINPDYHKDDEHMIEVDGVQYHDYVMYGNRPWVVVSCDENNIKNQMVTIVPMSSGKAFTSRYNHSHVDIFFAGRDTCVMCEQIRTVNAMEMKEYVSTLDASVMDKIEDAIMYHTGIVNKIKFSDDTTRTALDKIEHIIESIIKTKVEETVPTRATQTDIDDAITRISDSLENILNEKLKGIRTENTAQKPVRKTVSVKVKPDKESEVDKFYKRYPVAESTNTKDKAITKDRPTISTTKSENKGRTQRKWDKQMAKEFITDFDKMDVEKVMKKWGYQTRKTCLNMKYYLEKKFDTL